MTENNQWKSSYNQNTQTQHTVYHQRPINLSAGEYYFDGGLLELIGWRILGGLLVLFTFGIATPWAVTMIYRYEADHTVLDGRRLRFTGTGAGLFGQWIKWFLLTVITFGIYGFWVQIALKKWQVKHLQFID